MFSLPVAKVADACDGITFVPKKAIASLNVKLGDNPVKETFGLPVSDGLLSVVTNATPVTLCVLITSTTADRKLNPIFALVTETLALAAVPTLRRDKLIPALVTKAVPGIVTSTERRAVDSETPVTVTDRSTTLRFQAPEFQVFLLYPLVTTDIDD